MPCTLYVHSLPVFEVGGVRLSRFTKAAREAGDWFSLESTGM